MIGVGCAGWSLPRVLQGRFAPGDSHLQRYASRLRVTEINSSFHRAHAPSVYARWAATVPPGFRFSAKLPKTITHVQKLRDCEAPLQAFLDEVRALGTRLGCLLVQLPPSLAFEAAVAQAFLALLRRHWPGPAALEPRHASWFEPGADALLRAWRIARVLADPVRHPAGRAPGGWPGLLYLRLHGSPRMYHSAYEPALIEALGRRLQLAQAQGACEEAWCIFDNTASGAAVADALALVQALAAPGCATPAAGRAGAPAAAALPGTRG